MSSHILAWVAVGLTACNHDRVNQFRVEFPSQFDTISVCPKERVRVRWDVEGDATLGTAKGGPDSKLTPQDFATKNVAPKGDELVEVTQSTAFRVTARNANPAKDGAYATQFAEVPVAPIFKGNTSKCDAAGKCKASFNLEATPSMLVRWVGYPSVQWQGKGTELRICVSRDGILAGCVDPGSIVNLGNVSAGGVWTLEADVPPSTGVTANSVPLLKLQFDFGCPPTH